MVEVFVKLGDLRRFQATQEHIHRTHNHRMRIEGATRKTDVGRSIFAVALHERPSSADDADGQATANRLAVSDEICLHTEVFLRSTLREAKTEKHLIENQHDAALCADLAQLPKPRRVSRLVKMRAPPAVDQTGVRRRSCVWMQSLHWIHEHAGDVSSSLENAQRFLRHLSQRIGLVCRDRIADTRLYVAP